MNVAKEKVTVAAANLLDRLPTGTLVRLVVSPRGFRLSVRGLPETIMPVEKARQVLADHLGATGDGAIYALSEDADEVSAGIVRDTPAETGNTDVTDRDG